MNIINLFIIFTLFVILTPGVILRLPLNGNKYLVAITHAFIFTMAFGFITKYVTREGAMNYTTRKAVANSAGVK